MNTYGYAYQNPVNYIDPDGQVAFAVIPFFVGLFEGVSLTGAGTALAGGGAVAILMATPSDSSDDADARKDAQHERYHRICDQPPPPPSGDACLDAKRKRDQAQLCYDLRKNWSDKWDEPGSDSWVKHQGQLEQVKNRISNAVDEIIRHCGQDCL